MYTYIGYNDENGQRHLDRFLMEHMGGDHELVFLSEHHYVEYGENQREFYVYDYLEDVNYPEVDPEKQTDHQALADLIENAKKHPDLAEHRVREAFELGRVIRGKELE